MEKIIQKTEHVGNEYKETKEWRTTGTKKTANSSNKTNIILTANLSNYAN